MELKLSSPSSPPDCATDPEEQDVSDDDDDDRNHKHRRREMRSQFLERDQPEQFMSRPYRKRSRPFENGHSIKQGDSQSNYQLAREFPFKSEKRRSSAANLSRFSSDMNQRFDGSQLSPSDLAFGRGRLRDSSSWGQHDSRFTMVDAASSLFQPGSVPPMFAGRGLHNVSNVQSASWSSGFGLLPGIGGMDTFRPLGSQGSLRPPLNPSLSMAIPRQRCRDFEERGFCLRGDMCPMEHGVNRIVVEDVQSLSQFNLPVSLPSAHVLGSAGSGVVPLVDASSSALISSKGLHDRTSMSGRDAGSYTLEGVHSGSVDACGADVYDPDQPLWNSDCPEASTGLLDLQQPNVDETECLMGAETSDRLVRCNEAAVALQPSSSSVWGRISSSKHGLQMKEKVDSGVNSSEFPKNRTKDKHASPGVQGMTSHPRKQNNGAAFVDSSSNQQSDTGHSFKRSAPKALRTLFVNGIPLKDNKRETLLSHFRKFGEVIDIYNPSNTERAFVQFSTREEAERALQSPDAVMGNRFIKLWWANRDNIVDDSASVRSNMPITPNTVSMPSIAAHSASASTATKVNMENASNSPCFQGIEPKTSNGPKATLPVLKKLDKLDELKELVRRKQEILEQKRNELQHQLDKYRKKTTGMKGESPAAVLAVKKHILYSPSDSAKAGNSISSESQIVGAELVAEGSLHKSQTASNTAWHGLRPNLAEPSSLKRGVSSFGQFGASISINRYKLDNRPTSFTVSAPLPAEFANVDALREHFASFGELSKVEFEGMDAPTTREDDTKRLETNKNVSARVSFKTRLAAERAFMNGKTRNGHSLKFAWITKSSNSSTSQQPNSPNQKVLSSLRVQSTEKPTTDILQNSFSGKGSSSSMMKETSSDVDIQSQKTSTCDVSEDSCGGNGSSLAISKSGEAQSENRSYTYSSSKEDNESIRTGLEVGKNVEIEYDFQQMKSVKGFELVSNSIEGERSAEKAF